MKKFSPQQYDLLIRYYDTKIAVVKNQPYRPEIGDILETGEDDEWYEIIGFPKNIKPLTGKSWLVQVFHSKPFFRKEQFWEKDIALI
jgi:hypothetical protein